MDIEVFTFVSPTAESYQSNWPCEPAVLSRLPEARPHPLGETGFIVVRGSDCGNDAICRLLHHPTPHGLAPQSSNCKTHVQVSILSSVNLM